MDRDVLRLAACRLLTFASFATAGGEPALAHRCIRRAAFFLRAPKGFQRCSRCGRTGHNVRRCKLPPP